MSRDMERVFRPTVPKEGTVAQRSVGPPQSSSLFPAMTAIVHNVRPRALGSGTQDNEPFLQHFYFVAVIVIAFVLVLLRIIVLRRRNQALSNFFLIGGNSQYSYGSYPPHDSSHGSMYHGIQLSPPPAVYRPDRRVRAADIDPHGRRLGSGGEGSDGKDALPAYDSLDRPPKYIEGGWSHRGPSPSAEQSAATSSPEGQQSGSAQQNTTHVVTGSNVQQSNDTHTMAGPVYRSESTTGPDSERSI